MPDLEERIAAWRQQMAASGIVSPQVLDELESHLRDDIERRLRSGTNPPAAFAEAVERIGHAAELKSEFGKINDTVETRRREYLWKGSALGAGMFLAGVSFCYFAVLPLVMPANEQYAVWLGMETPPWRGTAYLSFVCKLLFGFGVAFALPAGLFTLVKTGFIDFRRLVSLRRYVIVINLILGALLTTPEIVTQLLMFFPLQLIYELGVLLVWRSQRKEMKFA